MFLFFLRLQYFLLFCFMSAAPIVRPSFFFMHAHFSIGTSRALFFASCLVSFSYVQNKRSNEIRVLSCLWHLIFFFRVAAHNYHKNFRRALKLKIKLLRVRPWCANSVSLLPPIIMVSLLITRFLLPALCCTLLAYCSLLLSARCSMIGYYVL